jgi:hypothetical protein
MSTAVIVVVVTDHRSDVWTLHRRDNGEIVADLVVTGGTFPWLNAHVNQHEGLDDLRPLFAEELRLLDRIDDDVEPWERAYEAVRNAVILRYPQGHKVPEFLLHIDGDDAWWRWNDEPFDESP